ncbi:MAG TPA: M14 family metallocarboxypeptidase, partial [Candidatus Methylacidiphilales bacterium]|nr:M14 family metallocarboxypeptidase [Candidatus Methylacidiphilales bacterium]
MSSSLNQPLSPSADPSPQSPAPSPLTIPSASSRAVPVAVDAYAQEIVALVERLNRVEKHQGDTTAIGEPRGGWEIGYLSPSEQGHPRPWFKRWQTDAMAPTLYVSTGTHGDEPSGPYAMLELLEDPTVFQGLNVALFPMINPDGHAVGKRENANGIDVNRDYFRLASTEARGHVEALKTLPAFDAYLCLHEDYEARGAYVFELNLKERQSPTLDLVMAMSQHIPIELAATIDDFPALQGVILRTDAHRHQMREDWPEALYLSYHHADMGYTTETPSMLPLPGRVAAQAGAVR